MKTILKSKDLSAQDAIALTINPGILKLSGCEGKTIPLDRWILYTECEGTPDEKTIFACFFDNQRYATNSKSFIKDFQRIYGMLNEYDLPFTAFTVIGGDSRGGRHFITCGVSDS